MLLGNLVIDFRTHFVANSTDYQVLRSLLILDNQQFNYIYQTLLYK